MYGLLGRMTAIPGQRDALVENLLRGSADLPGCRSYVVARDLEHPDGIWVTEVWDSEQLHDDSLALPQVQEAIIRARPLIAGFDIHTVTEPVGGVGLR
ncbi:MAG: putative quinol monooxygenase [Actinomycetes bacterium]